MTWQALAHVTLPLAVPGVVTVAIFSFLAAWNDFFFALILTRGQAQTAPVAIMGYTSFLGWEWGRIAAGSTLVLVPSLLIALLVRRYLISGLTSGTLKDWGAAESPITKQVVRSDWNSTQSERPCVPDAQTVS